MEGKFKETALKCTEGTFRIPVGKSMYFGLLVCLVFFLFGQVFLVWSGFFGLVRFFGLARFFICLVFFIQWFFSQFFFLLLHLKTTLSSPTAFSDFLE